MKKLKVKLLQNIYQGILMYAKAGETLEIIECTEQTTSIVDKEGMTRKLPSSINYLIETKLLEIKSFKF